MPNPKQWTILVWMAGDNDLESYGRDDIQELKRVGSTADVDVVVQLDTMRDDRTRRYHLHSGTSLDEDVVQDLGETNTGDPQVAIDFFTWGLSQYPAKHSLAVIWNHGSGIDETDVYRRAATRGITVERRPRPSPHTLPRSRVRAIVSRRFRRALFSTTIDAAIARRAIAYDDTSRDFLDNIELQKVLATVRQRTKRKLDLLGFDACLMNMVEVAYQLRNAVGFIVGSEEAEPGDGWPYDKILADLAAKPSMTPPELGATVVRRYVESYRAEAVTQSLLDIARLPAVARVVDALAGALLAAIKTPVEYAAVTKAVLNAQSYDVKDFIDLADLCEQLKKRSKSTKVKETAQATIEALKSGDGRLVAAEQHRGSRVRRSSGASIYFPRGEATVAYGRLDFAKATRWGALIRAYTSA